MENKAVGQSLKKNSSTEACSSRHYCMAPSLFGGSFYGLAPVDDYSSKLEIFFSNSRDQVIDTFHEYMARLDSEKDKRLLDISFDFAAKHEEDSG